MKDVVEPELISGLGYSQFCDLIECPRHNSEIDISSISENVTVFLNLDYFEKFIDKLESAKFKYRFNLVTHNSDRDFDQAMLERISGFTEKIYAINCTAEGRSITKIPIGVSDRSLEQLKPVQDINFPKTELAYLNFTKEHHLERLDCFDYFKDMPWATIENPTLSSHDFYDRLKAFKYCISPRGTGIDTHRIYESIIFNTIPIVKTSKLDSLYQHFPILIIKNWSDVTADFLNSQYLKLSLKMNDWKKSQVDLLSSKFWIHQ